MPRTSPRPPVGTARAVREAAELVGADAFVRALPDGYGTVVGEGGRPLSAGQARRLALARVFLRDAPLVVLDEPTANVDAATAATIGEAIAGLGGEHTVLLIAHAADVARRADRVVGLTAGRVADDRWAVAAP